MIAAIPPLASIQQARVLKMAGLKVIRKVGEKLPCVKVVCQDKVIETLIENVSSVSWVMEDMESSFQIDLPFTSIFMLARNVAFIYTCL